MVEENTDSMTDDRAAEADFGAGFAGTEGKTQKTPPVVAKPAASAPAQPTEEPETVKITRKDWDEVQAAARRTATYEHQFSKLHGTTGKMQQTLNEMRNQTTRDLNMTMPDNAFSKMEKDFPELAKLIREESREAFANLKERGNAKPDAETIRQFQVELEKEDLADEFPDWKVIVGAVETGTDPDPNNGFRKWLAAKDQTYQDSVNGTIRASIIARAIRRFQTETRPKPTAKPREDVRADRMKEAVQPRGDGGGAPPGKAPDDDFLAGFNSR